jgi:DNA-binding CsgD family transcriptional regulator
MLLHGSRVVTPLAQSLVGRDSELELLDRLLDEACAGSSRFVVVTGEPGIGKTSLLAELGRRAEERGCLVLDGRAAELESELPFGLVVDAFDAYLESLDARTYDRLAADELGELASVFPALRSLRSSSDGPGTAVERFRAHHAVRELMERLAARQPLALMLDDVHWSDGASVELIGHLLRRRPEAAVMVAAAFRTGQAGDAFAGAIEAAARAGEIERLALGPLGVDEAGALVEVDDAAHRERLYRESGGNPFYLLQLARSGAGAAGGAAHDGGPDSTGVPSAVMAAIASELASLSAPERGFAEAAAVAGDPFELDVAVATADMSESDALAALDELVARDLVRPAAVPRRFRFRHPLVRSAIYASCSPGVRLSAHERSARALAERGAPATARAHHVEQSARHGDAEGVAVLREAGDAASGRAPSSAARWYEAALRILPASADSAQRAGLLTALAQAKAATGKLEESRAALLETIGLVPDDEPLRRVKLTSTCAAVEQVLGRHREAHARLQGALAELSEPESVEGASLMIDLAWDAGLDEKREGMLEWAVKALETARPLGDGPLTAAAAGIAAVASAWEGSDTAAEYRAEAAALVDSLPDDSLARRPAALQYLSAAEFFLDRFEEGIAHGARGLALARAGGQGELLPGMIQALTVQLILTGRLSEAAAILDDAVDAARLTDNAVALSWTLGARCYAGVVQGDVAGALKIGEEALALAEGLDDRFVKGRISVAIGLALLHAGRPARGAELMVQGTGGEEMPAIPGGWKVVGLEALTRCLLALDRQADAERVAAHAAVTASAIGLPFTAAVADRAAALVMLGAGDAAGAAERALASAARAEEVGARVEAGVSRTVAGRALAETGDRDRAAAELERAAAELEECGALRHRDEAEHELRKLGHAVHRRTKRGKAGGHGVESLTGRELEIARLVVARRTNPQIAAELFLSIKTVETHLRNIFRKLDVDSRVDVARIVERARVL